MENVVKYLRENKDKYSKDALVNALRKADYKENDILAGLKKVYNETAARAKGGHIYYNGKEKAIDFFAGLLLPWLLFLPKYFLHRVLYVPHFWRDMAIFVIVILYVAGLIYLYRKRRYFFYGMLFNILGIFIFQIFI